MKKAGFLTVLGAVFAPNSNAAAQDPNSTPSTIGSAAAWDVAKAVDPFFITDVIEMLLRSAPPPLKEKEEGQDPPPTPNRATPSEVRVVSETVSTGVPQRGKR
jgi:hypothetical protein